MEREASRTCSEGTAVTIDQPTRALLEDVRRDIDDAAEEISQAVSKLEEDEEVSSEALLGEAITRLKLCAQRIDERLEAP